MGIVEGAYHMKLPKYGYIANSTVDEGNLAPP